LCLLVLLVPINSAPKVKKHAAKEKIRLTLVKIENHSYLSAANLKRIHSGIDLRYAPDAEQGEIRFGRRVLLFRLNDAQYQSQNEVVELDEPGAIDADGLFFSREFVEEILSELNVPVSYRFDHDHLTIVRAAARPSRMRLDFVVIDAGHGGKDSGALGYFDAAEKDITLALAHAVRKKLVQDYPELKVYMTRSTDKFLRLERRSELANKQNSDAKFGVFISIHCNSTLSPRVKGFEVYYLAQNPDNIRMRQIMLRENLRFERSSYIRRLKSQLMNAQIQRESKMLARSVFSGLMIGLDGMIKPRKVKKADFAVLRSTLMPAILIEAGYLTNRDDLKMLGSENYRKAFAQGVSNGIGAFLGDLAKAEE
jgi:N-acetylmuramoyl-L-alanine amidase